MAQQQSYNAASTYLPRNIARSQEKYFNKLIKMVDVQKGWRILDIGCATGNHTIHLSDMVGESGKIIAIDPIESRIEKAEEVCARDNVEYFVGFGQDARKYGHDFDLVIAATVMHWIPFDQQVELYQAVYDSLKPGGAFIFNSMIANKLNYMKLLPFLKEPTLESNIWATLHCHTEKEFRKLGKDSGFSETVVYEHEMVTPFGSLDLTLQHFAVSVHVVTYESFRQKLREMLDATPEAKTFLLSKEGKYSCKNSYCFVKYIK